MYLIISMLYQNGNVPQFWSLFWSQAFRPGPFSSSRSHPYFRVETYVVSKLPLFLKSNGKKTKVINTDKSVICQSVIVPVKRISRIHAVDYFFLIQVYYS